MQQRLQVISIEDLRMVLAEFGLTRRSESVAVAVVEDLPETLTIAQFCKWQQMSRPAAYQMAAANEGKPGTPFYRIGRKRGGWRVHRDRFLAWRDRHNREA